MATSPVFHRSATRPIPSDAPTRRNNAAPARESLHAAGGWTTAAWTLLTLLLLGSLALCPLHAQTAYFTGGVTTLGGGFDVPFGVALDGSGNIYIADLGNQAIKEMPAGCASSACVTTLLSSAGWGVAVDKSANVYFSLGNAVYELPAGCTSQACVTTLGGGFDQAQGIAVDKNGNVYVADNGNSAVKKIPPGCVSSACVVTLGGGFADPYDVSPDTSGNVYVADFGNAAIKEIPSGCLLSSCVITLGGPVYDPYSIAVDGSGNVYVGTAFDTTDSVLVEIPAGCVFSSCMTTVGGGLHISYGVAVDGAGNLYASDLAHNAVKEIMPHGVSLGTVAAGATSPALTLYFTFTAPGSGIIASVVTQGATGLDFADAGTGSCDTNGTSYTYSAGDICTMNVMFAPKYAGARYGAGELLNGSGDVIATALIYGTGEAPELVFPSNPAIQTIGGGFYWPEGIAFDGVGNVYVADYENAAVKEMPAGCTSSACVSTIGGGFGNPRSVAVDGAGNVYVADGGSNKVEEMPPGCASSSCVTTLGGGFNNPLGVAVDGSGNIYVAYYASNVVAEMPPGCTSSSCVTALGGSFDQASGVAVDANGDVYVASLASVKEMPPGCRTSTCVTTLGGGFTNPHGVAVDGSGNVYVADIFYSVVKEIPSGCTSSSCVSTLGGGFAEPGDVALDANGNVYVADISVNTVKELPLATPPSLSFASTHVGSQSSDSPQTVTLRNIGNTPLIFPVPSTGENPSVSANFTLDASTTCPEVLTSSSAGTLAAGASCNLAIDFIPTTIGSINGTATLTDNNLNVTHATQSIGLSGSVALAAPPTFSVPSGNYTSPQTVGITDTTPDATIYYTTNGTAPTTSSAVYSGPITVSSTETIEASATATGYSTSAAASATYTIAPPGNQGTTYTYKGNSYVTCGGSYCTGGPYALTVTFSTTLTGNALHNLPLTNITSTVTSFEFTDGSGLVDDNSTSSYSTFEIATDASGNITSWLIGTCGSTCNIQMQTNWHTPTSFQPGEDFSETTAGFAGSFGFVSANPGKWTPPLITPSVTVTPGQSSITTAQSLPVTVTVSGGSANPTPTGSVTLSSGSYTSSPATLTSGSATITIPAGSLAAGNETLTATYTPDTGSSSTYNSASGTAPVTVSQAIGSCTTANPNPNPNPASFAAVSDFNGDCKSDILWRNASTQQVYEWFMNGTTYPSSGSPGSPTSDWVIQGTGDFNGDGKSDILWRNSTTGQVFIWIMNGSTLTSSGSLGYVSSDWSMAGIGDFNGDGKADILWWNSSTGQVFVWFINGTTMSGGGSVSYISGGWTIQDVGDFNGDGMADILWRNSSTGQVFIWLMNGSTLTSSGSLSYVTSDWSIVGVGDFNGDGKSDILWRNSTTGQVYVWFINGTTMTGGGSVTYVSSAWVIDGLGDYDGSGRAGILWRNTSTEQVYIWLMNGATLTSSGSPGAPDATWQIAP